GRTWQWGGGEGHPVHSGLRSLKRKGGGGLNQDYFTGARPLKLQRGDRLFAHVWLDPKDPPLSVQLQFNNGKWEHRARWGAPAHGAGRKGGADHAAGPLPAKGRWVRLEVDLDKVALKPGDQLNGWAFTQVGGTVYWDRAGVKTWGIPDDRHLQSQLAWEQRSKGDGALPKTVRAALGVDAKKRSKKQIIALRNHYLRHVYGGTRQAFDPLEAELAAAKKKVTDFEKATPTTLVMKELAKPRPAYLLKRGQYDARGPQVERLTPAFLPPMADGLPRDRMGLAKWLLDPAHPLTARVTVNRYWQQLFGVGLVKTSEDFGNQGELPSHPLLLDWLATQFIADGWDVKMTIKRMVMSSAYRQSSRVEASLAARDPENRLLARGPRFRLDAEMLRDQALALSGLLVRKIGGPGVKPPQPDGLWFAVGYSGSNTVRFKPDKGSEKVHRRSLYTFWKRTAPPPQMSTMDAPSREVCSVRRERTNTPLQALLMMNDPQYVEAARHFAQRVLREGGTSARDRLIWSFRLATGHPPSAEDLADLEQFLSEQLAVYRGDLKSAQALIAIGELKAEPSLDIAELAAWTMVANLLLNLDEVVTKG
ncbi:MAG: DUF1553 domain-containing protein, partial [Planctomycetota bacterium]|nr:DUF1553 domain-containing protein [Planctomycetota bacterium]